MSLGPSLEHWRGKSWDRLRGTLRGDQARLGGVLRREHVGSAQPPGGPLPGLRRGQVGSQEDSLDQGLAVSSPSMGACKERFPYGGPGQSGRATWPVPHSPSQSPADTGAGIPLAGTAIQTVVLEPRSMLLLARCRCPQWARPPSRISGPEQGGASDSSLGGGPGLLPADPGGGRVCVS